MEYHHRKTPRMKHFDYASAGHYFLTICAFDKKRIFSDIITHPENGTFDLALSPIGKIIDDEILNIPLRFPKTEIVKYVIMPNHIHLIIAQNDANENCSISSVVQAFKSLSTRKIRRIFPDITVFQKSFHDHIIRSQQDFDKIWLYIDSNPVKWSEDCFFEPD